MPLSEAFNPNKPPNIKDISLAPEKKGSNKPFDPERDISEEDWGNILTSIEKERTDGVWYTWSSQDPDLFLLSEHKAELKLTDTDFRSMLNELDGFREKQRWNDFSSHAYILLTLFPERKSELKLTDKEFHSLLPDLVSCRHGGGWYHFFSHALKILTLFPDRREELGLDEEAFQGMLNELEWYRTRGNWHVFSRGASYLLALFPERKSELKLTDTECHSLLAELEQFRTNRAWGQFSSLALRLYIIFADEVKIDQNGTLEIIFNKPKPTELKEETPPLPTTRNY